jgi:hypothetical protein
VLINLTCKIAIVGRFMVLGQGSVYVSIRDSGVQCRELD